MTGILLCTHDPMLIKGLYGVMRDMGFDVDISDHPAGAVRAIMNSSYHTLIMDSRAFGLSADEASRIIREISPEIRIIIIGDRGHETDLSTIKVPLDLQALGELLNASGCHRHPSHHTAFAKGPGQSC